MLQIDRKYSLGFSKPSPITVFGSSDNAFGTPGAGGSFGLADPDTGVGFAYVMNRLGYHLIDPRDAPFATHCSTTSWEPGPKLETAPCAGQLA